MGQKPRRRRRRVDSPWPPFSTTWYTEADLQRVQTIKRDVERLFSRELPEPYLSPTDQDYAVVFHDEDHFPFAFIEAYKVHVNVNYTEGIDLDDPKGLLQGRQKRARWVRLERPEQVKEHAKELVRLALDNREIAIRRGEPLVPVEPRR